MRACQGYRSGYSGFFQTDLHILLQELGVKTVVMTGLHTQMRS